MVIENYPDLQSIVVKKNSLSDLKSLKICNCEKLNSFEIEDDNDSDNDIPQYSFSFTRNTLMNVKNVIIESTSFLFI